MCPSSPNQVQGKLAFAVDTGEKPATYTTDMDQQTGVLRTSGKFETRIVEINNGWDRSDQFDLDKQGFMLIDHNSAVTDFFDETQLTSIYYPECIQLVQDATGAARVYIFDHTFRIEDQKERDARGVRAPVPTVHNDYTNWSAPQRIRQLFAEDEAKQLLKKRYVMINVWQPLMQPVRTNPLVLCDAKTISVNDLLATDHIYPDRRGETYRVKYNADQKWFYFPEMQTKDAVLIKCFDSKTDGRARFSAHGAAELLVNPDDAIPRKSIEVRTIGFFDT